MDEETKWGLVNATETYEELASVIMIIAEDGIIHSNRQNKTFDAARQVRNVDLVINHNMFPNILTRAYGIRQQALYIRYYEQKESHVSNDTDRKDDDRTFRRSSTFGLQKDTPFSDRATPESGSRDPITS